MARRILTLTSVLVAILGVLYSYFSYSSNGDISDNQPLIPKESIAGRNNTALFMTNSDHGLRNAILATIDSLLVNHPQINVHVAGFPSLKPRIDEIVSYASHQNPHARVTFHELPGPSYGDTIFSGNRTILSLIHAPGFWGARSFNRDVSMFLMSWTGEQFLSMYERSLEIFEDVDPAIVAVDPALSPGVEAVKRSGRRWLILSTNSIRENAPHEQGLAMLWKYPAFATGWSYPVPWYLIPANVFLNLNMAFNIMTAKHIQERTAWLEEHGVPMSVGPLDPLAKDVPLCITQSLVGAEYPFVIPDKYKAYGPMVLSVAKASDQDPEMVAWMAQRPTVLINLGSVFSWDVEHTTVMAQAIKAVVTNHKVQVLWKLKRRTSFADHVYEDILGDEIRTGKVRVVPWFKADPTALMETGHVVLAVHHGGASSFYEPLSVGVPQMVLPHWADCYDQAAKAEYIGVGLRANGRSAPQLDFNELKTGFDLLLGEGEIRQRIVSRAKEVGAICQSAPGRNLAAAHVAHLASGKDYTTFKSDKEAMKPVTGM